MRVLFLIVAVMACAVSCATTGDVDNLQSRLRQQEMRNRQLEQQLGQTATQLQDEISKQSTPMRSTQANLNAEFEQLKTRVGALEGQFEEMKKTNGGASSSQKVNELSGQVQAIRSALQAQLGMDIAAPAMANEAGAPQAQAQQLQGQQPGGNGAPAPLIPGAPVSAPAPLAQTAPGQAAAAGQQAADQSDPAQALYDQAVKDFNAGKYNESLTNVEDFIKNYPKHALIPNAVFWRGENYFQLKDYAQAALAYQDVIDKYNKSNKYTSALFKQGLAFLKLDKTKAAKLRFQELVDKFPNTPEGKRASVEIKKIK